MLFVSTFQLFHMSLKRAKVTSSETTALEMLDPFVLLLLECVDSMHVKVVAFDWLNCSSQSMEKNSFYFSCFFPVTLCSGDH